MIEFNKPFKVFIAILPMVNEEKVKEAFKKAKDDVEGVKNELAFALRRIAKIEEILNKKAIEEIARKFKAPRTKSKKKKY